MLSTMKLSDDEKNKSTAFIVWCVNNNKDMFRVALDKGYMKKCVDEFEGGIKNEN